MNNPQNGASVGPFGPENGAKPTAVAFREEANMNERLAVGESRVVSRSLSELNLPKVALQRRRSIRDYRTLHNALKSSAILGASNFLLAYNIRAGLAVVLRAFRLAKKSPRSLFSLSSLLDEGSLQFRVDAVQLGLLVGGVSGGYNAILAVLKAMRGRNDGLNEFLAGALAGSSVLALDVGRQRTFALYLFARVLQCMYNSAKARGWWHFWGSHWQHGDALLFIMTSAQVMYAYVMRPNTLPKAYNDFIVSTGPIDRKSLAAVRANCRGEALDLKAMKQLVQHKARNPDVRLTFDTPFPKQIPCSVLHAQTDSHIIFIMQAFRRAFIKGFPPYLSLCLVPSIVLRFNAFLRRPLHVVARAIMSATRSTTFLASFVALYQASICLHRVLWPKGDHKVVYYFAELALYVLPRAADSLYMILRHRRWLNAVKGGEVILFALSMGALMYFYEHEKETMSPLFRKLFTRFMDGPRDEPPMSPKPLSSFANKKVGAASLAAQKESSEMTVGQRCNLEPSS